MSITVRASSSSSTIPESISALDKLQKELEQLAKQQYDAYVSGTQDRSDVLEGTLQELKTSIGRVAHSTTDAAKAISSLIAMESDVLESAAVDTRLMMDRIALTQEQYGRDCLWLLQAHPHPFTVKSKLLPPSDLPEAGRGFPDHMIQASTDLKRALDSVVSSEAPSNQRKPLRAALSRQYQGTTSLTPSMASPAGVVGIRATHSVITERPRHKSTLSAASPLAHAPVKSTHTHTGTTRKTSPETRSNSPIRTQVSTSSAFKDNTTKQDIPTLSKSPNVSQPSMSSPPETVQREISTKSSTSTNDIEDREAVAAAMASRVPPPLPARPVQSETTSKPLDKSTESTTSNKPSGKVSESATTSGRRQVPTPKTQNNTTEQTKAEARHRGPPPIPAKRDAQPMKSPLSKSDKSPQSTTRPAPRPAPRQGQGESTDSTTKRPAPRGTSTTQPKSSVSSPDSASSSRRPAPRPGSNASSSTGPGGAPPRGNLLASIQGFSKGNLNNQEKESTKDNKNATDSAMKRRPVPRPTGPGGGGAPRPAGPGGAAPPRGNLLSAIQGFSKSGLQKSETAETAPTTGGPGKNVASPQKQGGNVPRPGAPRQSGPPRPLGGGQNSFLSSIQGFSKNGLRKTDTVVKDASKPGTSSAGTGSGSRGPSSGGASTGGGPVSLMDAIKARQARMNK